LPKRLLDGEKLWRSDKLKRVNPKKFRAEYANLLPLALANGSFECDPNKVWAQVYSYNRADIRLADVGLILAEFERVKLLFRWTVDNKPWGFWVGIDQEGLLPPEKQRHRYKTGAIPPSDELNAFISSNIDQPPDNIQITSGGPPSGLAVGLALGLVRLAPETKTEPDNKSNEVDMSFKNAITDKARENLNARIFPTDSAWSEMNSLKRIHGQAKVVDAFSDWTDSVAGESIPHPLTEFLNMAGMLLDPRATKANSVKPLILKLSVLSDGVTFSQKQSFEIARLLETYTEEQIVAAFRDFYPTLDDYSLKFAGKDFTEKAEQLIAVQIARQKRSEELVQTMTTLTAEETRQAEKEREESAKKRAKEEALAKEEPW
jgi:hypothetical protein